MTGNQIARLVIDVLDDLGVKHMVVGSLSSNVWGIPRSTQDADFVIATDDRLAEVIQRLSPTFAHQSQIEFETVQMTTKYLFEHRESGFRVELFLLSDDPHDRERFRRRIRIQRDELVTYVPTPEDVIIQKLRWGRRKDASDVRDVIDVQGDALDFDYIRSWTDRHGSTERLDRILSDPDPA